MSEVYVPVPDKFTVSKDPVAKDLGSIKEGSDTPVV